MFVWFHGMCLCVSAFIWGDFVISFPLIQGFIVKLLCVPLCVRVWNDFCHCARTYYLICGARVARISVCFLRLCAAGVLLSSAGRLIKAQEGFTRLLPLYFIHSSWPQDSLFLTFVVACNLGSDLNYGGWAGFLSLPSKCAFNQTVQSVSYEQGGGTPHLQA